MKKNSTLSCSVSSYCRLRLRRLGLRSFAMSAFLLAGTVSSSAQSGLTNVGIFSNRLDPVPGIFSYDGKTRLLEKPYEYSGPYTINVYDSEFKKEKQITFKDVPSSVEYYDLNQGTTISELYDVLLTQTLFNQDEKYEAIVENYDASGYQTGFSVVQEDGTVLFTTQYKNYNNVYFHIIKVGDLYYLSVKYEDDNYYDYSSIYRIDREGSSGLTFVKKIKGMSVSPTVLDRSTPVTVDFKEGEGQHEVRVVTAGGKTVHKESVDGASSVTLDTSRWGSGMNIVTVRDKNGKTESCKVIVK